MIARLSAAILGCACLATATALLGPTAADLRAPVQWLARPAVLPFLWRDLGTATRSGDAAETFAVARRILQLLPAWTDGQIVFAYRFATRTPTTPRTPAERGSDAFRRLQIALAWLESVRPEAATPAREVELLLAMAELPIVAERIEPTISKHLQQIGGAERMGDGYLAAAELLTSSQFVQEDRTLRMVPIAGGLLAQGDRQGAIAVLATAIARCADLSDRELSTELAYLLDLTIRHLQGEEVDITDVRADTRMSPLLPHLR